MRIRNFKKPPVARVARQGCTNTNAKGVKSCSTSCTYRESIEFFYKQDKILV